MSSGQAPTLERIAGLVAAGWGLQVAHAERLSGGLVNQVWQLTAVDGSRWVLKEYTPDLAGDAAFTLGIQEWVRDRGLPVPQVRPTLAGPHIYRYDGGVGALSAFLPGQACLPAELSQVHLAAVGDVLARLHLALLDHPASAAPPRQLDDPARLEAAMQGVEAMAKARPFSPEVDTLVRRCLATKREAVARWGLGSHLYEGAIWQLLHKDFRLENLLFDPAGQVTAILDFDFARDGYRAWEVMRAAMTATWLPLPPRAGQAGQANETAGTVVPAVGMDLERAGVLLRAYLARVLMASGEVRNLGRLWLDNMVRTFWPISVPYENPAVWHDGLAQVLRDRDDFTRWFSDHLGEVDDWLAGLQ